ncbi:glycoside hydrolase family 3 protein [Plantactinospora soyae]|uniref:Exo-alpha-(1->6)-L-arabinopyranosidase n=1 Tax=Plantactinospora soyae TaxID=1544732 RepID=A0A927MDW5_9ACTN|nr:glycoside hydrolase family 3 protein [Plantactinospora soyae]MBE1491870.1 beta-glucosidase [Plantactinospora soyae]
MRHALRSRRIGSVLVLSLVAALAMPGQATAEPADALPFRNPELSLDARLDDLVGRLTLDEKLALLHQAQAAVPRLDIGFFKTGTEALHGVAWSNNLNDNWNQVLAEGTVFPQALGLASTWDPELVRRVGSATGDELRGYHSVDPTVWGLQVWAPVVNLLRDPRWGRNEEGYSEDPTLTGKISTAYGRGLSGDDPDHLKTAPVLKHYYAYNNEVNRSLTSSNLPPRVKHEYDEAAFRPAIAADAVTGVMASYNKVNGRPTHVDPDLAEVVRSWTDRELFNVSDAWAPHALTEAQHYFDDPTEAQAYAAMLKAGLDSFTVDNSDSRRMVDTLKLALDRGLLTVADVDRSVRRALSIRFRLGEFDPDGGPYADITADVIDSPAHRALNRQAADAAAVLLRNSGNTLPLDPARTGKVAVVGPLHDTLFSDWYGGKLPYQVTPLDGIRNRLGSAGTVTGVEGLDRVALRDVASGRYLSATGTGAGDSVVASAGTPTPAGQWDVNDWMGDYSTLRNAANGRYLTGNFGPFNTSAQAPNGWYVQQQFRLERQDDGTYLIQYVGYETAESWWWIPEHYVTVAPDGTVGTGAKADAARFAREVVNSGAGSAVAAAADADVAVVVVGSNPFVYGREIHDRTSTALGESQQKLIEAVTRANRNTVVVLESSYPTTMRSQPRSLLWTTHAGSETGQAVADVLFGDHNPAGRLTQTWYRSDDDLPPDALNYDIIDTDQTYLYYRGTPLFAFGHGLSYTTFRYGRPRLSSPAIGAGDTVTVSVDVTNTGRRTGAEVVQLYTHQRTSRDKVPVKQLRAFEKVSLAPGATKTVRLTLRAADLAHWDVTRSRSVVETSDYDLLVGASSADIRERATLRVRGETIPPRDLSRPTRAENFDGYAGIQLVDESKERGTAVGAVRAGNWIRFDDVKLGKGTGTFTASAARADAGDATIEVRLDSPTGRLLGRATVANTGDVYRYATSTAGLTGVGGVRDVYLVFGGDLRLATFSIG